MSAGCSPVVPGSQGRPAVRGLEEAGRQAPAARAWGAHPQVLRCHVNAPKTPAVLSVSIHTTCTLDSRTDFEGEIARWFLGMHHFQIRENEKKRPLERKKGVVI